MLSLAGSDRFMGIADMDGDGFPDLLVRTSSSVRSFPGAGGSYGSSKNIQVSTGAHVGGFCNLMDDGFLSVLLHTNRGWHAYDIVERGTRMRSPLRRVEPADVIAAGDFSGDGGCELLTHSSNGGGLAIGPLTRQSFQPQSIGSAAGWRPVGVGYKTP